MEKSELVEYGPMNDHALVLVLKELMRRATMEIWKRRVTFEGEDKTTEYKTDPTGDRVTDADYAAQRVLLKGLKESFPCYGIVAEEDDFRQGCTIPGRNLFFTVDPLDGTKAYDRRQSHGFGPMLSLCDGDSGKVLAAFVGDAMTHELYYYRPGSERVHRINFNDDQHQLLVIDHDRYLRDQYVLLRDHQRVFPDTYRSVADSVKYGGIFKDIEIAGGGIGTGFARLWKGEVGAYVLKDGNQAPWDLMPVLGISNRLGFLWMHYTGKELGWLIRNPSVLPEIQKFDTPSIVIHASRLAEFLEAAR